MTRYTCKHCDRSLDTEALLMSHLRWVHGMKISHRVDQFFDGGIEKLRKEIEGA